MKRQKRFYNDGDLFQRQKYAHTESGSLKSVKKTRVKGVFLYEASTTLL